MISLPPIYSNIAESPVGSEIARCNCAGDPFGMEGASSANGSWRKASTASATVAKLSSTYCAHRLLVDRAVFSAHRAYRGKGFLPVSVWWQTTPLRRTGLACLDVQAAGEDGQPQVAALADRAGVRGFGHACPPLLFCGRGVDLAFNLYIPQASPRGRRRSRGVAQFIGIATLPGAPLRGINYPLDDRRNASVKASRTSVPKHAKMTCSIVRSVLRTCLTVSIAIRAASWIG